MNFRMNWVTFLRKTEVSFVSLSCILQTLWQSQLGPTEILSFFLPGYSEILVFLEINLKF